MNSKLLLLIAGLILIPIYASISYADDQSEQIDLCELLGGVWEPVHGVCDGISDSFCDTMGGTYQECKTPEYFCPLNEPSCSVGDMCQETCVFSESVESTIPIKSSYPACPANGSCYGHYEQFLKDAPEFRVTIKENHVYPMSYVLENAVLQNVGFIEENPTLIFNIEPTNDGHLLLSIQSDLFYPRFMHNEAKYIVFIDGKEMPFFQHNPQVIEIPFQKDNYEIRIGGDLHKMDTSTVLYESIEFPYRILPKDIPPNVLTLKLQLDYEINPNDIECPNPDHVLTKRPNGKIACVFSDTADKLLWYKYT